MSNQTNQELLEAEGRVPPQAVEVEEAVLGSMLMEPEAVGEALQKLTFEDLYKPAHQHIFKVIGKLYDQEEQVDLLSVEQELRDQGLLDTVGGTGKLSELTRSMTSASNIGYHSNIIKEKSLKRQTILGSQETIKRAYDPATNAYDVLDYAASSIDSLSLGHEQRQAMRMGDVLPEVLDEIGLAMENPSNITGVPSGLDIDDYTSGWQPQNLILIAARPSMGKTALALNIARFAAANKYEDMRTNVAIFNMEMGKKSLVRRFLSEASGINQELVNSGKINKKEYEKLCTETAGYLNNIGIYLDDTPALDIRTLRSKCRRQVRKNGVGLIIIDYIQLMSARGDNLNTREQEVAYISRSLKKLGIELDVPVIALSQLSRAVEQRGGNKRPQLSDLRESGQLEQDADLVCFLYRPEYYDIKMTPEGKPTENQAEIIIAKQRNGPTASVWLNFFKESGRFRNISKMGQDEEGMPF